MAESIRANSIYFIIMERVIFDSRLDPDIAR